MAAPIKIVAIPLHPASAEIGRLRELAQADPRPLAEIAEAGGISYDLAYQVLSGRRANPYLGTVKAILNGLGKHWADLEAR